MSDAIPKLLALGEVAECCRVSPHTVRKWVREGRLRPVRICRRLLFHPDEIARFLTNSQR
jgi:excisionase family DNA binding protein